MAVFLLFYFFQKFCRHWNCAWTLLNYEDSTPVRETGRNATKVGGLLKSLS